jgi:hypothetical protein
MRQLELPLSPKVYCYPFSYRRGDDVGWRARTGYNRILVWSRYDFIVSRNGFEWYIMYQVSYGRGEFLRIVDETVTYYGDADSVWQQLKPLCDNSN